MILCQLDEVVLLRRDESVDDSTHSAKIAVDSIDKGRRQGGVTSGLSTGCVR